MGLGAGEGFSERLSLQASWLGSFSLVLDPWGHSFFL
jgi:hypothetical protein